MKIEKAKKILNGETNERYNDEEVQQILEFVNLLASIAINIQLKEKKISNEKCDFIRQSFNGRTSG